MKTKMKRFWRVLALAMALVVMLTSCTFINSQPAEEEEQKPAKASEKTEKLPAEEQTEEEKAEALQDTEEQPLDVQQYTVIYKDYLGNDLATVLTAEGETPESPDAPEREGYVFVGWRESSPEKEEVIATPVYEEASGITLYAGKVWVNAGDASVEIPVSILKNPGILGMTLTVSFDESAVVLQSAQCGEAFKDVLVFTPANELKSGCRFLWDGLELEKGQIQDGTVLMLNFKVLDTAAPGTYPITVTCGENAIVDGDLNTVDCGIISGEIIISE